MRTLFLVLAAAAGLAAAPVASAQEMRRSHVECAVRAFPAASRAEFRRQYATNPETSFQVLLRPEGMQAMLGCVEPHMLEGAPEVVEQRGEWLGRAWASHEMMTAAEAAIAATDAGYARNLDGAYARLTASQRASLTMTEDDPTDAATASALSFASMVSPALTLTALDANPQILAHLTIYAASRATYEDMVAGR